jgi:hypothetical protein
LLLLVLLVSGTAAAVQPIGTPLELSSSVRTGDRFMRIRLLGTLRLSNAPVDGFGAVELSAIGWSEDEAILYALSDAGYVVELRPSFDGDRLVGVDLLASHALLARDGRMLRHYLRDAEGLSVRNGDNGTPGDTELLISFEGTPRIDAYATDGRWLRRLSLPRSLSDEDRFACRNCQLEALTETPLLGVVVAPQRPLKDVNRGLHSLYDSHDRIWTFPPLDGESTSLVDLAAEPDGRVLVLERRYQSIFMPVIFAIRRLTADVDANPAGGPLSVEDLAIINNTEGWSIDNFEGIAHHRGNRWFMVSDDNNSALQSTILVYFEIQP